MLKGEEVVIEKSAQGHFGHSSHGGDDQALDEGRMIPS